MAENYNQATSTANESVLFVDDEPYILTALRRLMRPLKLEMYFAESGDEGLKILKDHKVDLIVSDMRMPQMDGAEFLTKAKVLQPDSIRILLTGYADMTSTIDALNHGGIYRYISKPWEDDELKSIIFDGLKLKRLERERAELIALTQKQNDELQDLNKNLEVKVEARTEEIKQTAQMLDLAYKDLKLSYDSFVLIFSNFINTRQTLQKAESKLVAELSKKMAIALKLKEKSIQNIYYAGLLHQIGKMSLPDSLLALSEDEMSESDLSLYKQYPQVGETALTTINGFEKTALLIRNHTEYCDGSGYPDGLKIDEIRSGARIIRTVRDFLGLQTGIMSTTKLNSEKAFNYITERSGKEYDPIVVKCLDHFRKDYDLSTIYTKEIEVNSLSLLPGMLLSRNLVNSKGLLLISKGHILNDHIITKIIAMEESEEAKFKIYIAKNYEHHNVSND
ncbi:MAG: response regulator RpfG family c-di-GMP phosphodiesterase [Oleiphilaceae bacterium]|jgi:response regulator RpfG family c-di-GMP phosphodiesterase